jgi:hypothetical protein
MAETWKPETGTNEESILLRHPGKRQRAGALHDAPATAASFQRREASWSAAALRRFRTGKPAPIRTIIIAHRSETVDPPISGFLITLMFSIQKMSLL